MVVAADGAEGMLRRAPSTSPDPTLRYVSFAEWSGPAAWSG